MTPGPTMRAMAAPRLLVIEDDPSLQEAVTVTLRSAGFEVRAESDGSGLAAAVVAFHPDLAILDVRLPAGEDGFSLAVQLRTIFGIPIVFATAADSLDERLRGFDVGADDYIVKPFAAPELVARVRAVLRRSGRLRSPTCQVFDLIIDEANRTANRGGHDLQLTKTEFDLLAVLIRAPGKLFSKAQLLSLVWGFAGYDANLVEVHTSALRRKLEAHGGRLIHTERGKGYVLRSPVPS
jgi:two-component system, OmpR family, response regulator